MPSVLFVCTANQFRSVIAAACFLKSLSEEGRQSDWTVESAGTWGTAGLPAPGMTIQAAKQLGLEGIDHHRTRQVDQALLDPFDLIIVMERGHKEAICSEFRSVRDRVHLLSDLVDGMSYDVPDPGYGTINPYEVGRQLEMLVSRGKEKIMQLAGSPRI